MFRAKQLFFAFVGAASLAAVSLSPAAAQTISQSGCVRYDNRLCTTMQTCVLDTATKHGACYYYVHNQYAYYEVF